jgi:hypothetical protein
MLHPKLKLIHCPDVDNLEKFNPDDPENFSLLLYLFITAEGYDGDESFDVLLCTPKWLMDRYNQDDIIVGAHHLIVFEYNYSNLVRRINKYLMHCSGNTWREVAEKVGRLGKWEFEDYIDNTGDQ